MSTLRLSLLAFAALALVINTGLSGCSKTADWVADTVLANEVRFDDREAPRTAYAIAASADAVQTLGGQGAGLSCSLPWGAQTLAFTRKKGNAPIALQMRQACAFHDYCYRHGNATYGYSQADCDFMLQQQAFRLCKFINAKNSINKCESAARKVTLGVRVGGAGNFKRARAMEDEHASTFFEFDPYPVRATRYRVVRIADAPQQWLKANDGVFAKAAYHFDIRPSGSLVHVLGWNRKGDTLCSSFKLPASYDGINGPPTVVRDSPDGEDWFVWWNRAELSASYGYLAVLPPGRATKKDWETVAGGLTSYQAEENCKNEIWRAQLAESEPAPLGFLISTVKSKDPDEPPKTLDLEFSELHPVNGTNTPGFIQLMALSTHSCVDSDATPCLVSMVIDTQRQTFQAEPKSPMSYRAQDPNCVKATGAAHCDRYRNYVGAPYVSVSGNKPSLVWLRRGKSNGDGYEERATVRRYTIGETPEAPGVNLGELVLEEYSEEREPALLLRASSTNPLFLSLESSKQGIKAYTQEAMPKGAPLAKEMLKCLSGEPSSWLQRPAFLTGDINDTNRSFLVFSRVQINDKDMRSFANPAALELAVTTVTNGLNTECSQLKQTRYPKFFKGFASEQEKTSAIDFATAIAAGKYPSAPAVEAAQEAIGTYVERVRGGQMVLADVNNDKAPDLLQIAQMPGGEGVRVGLLVGQLDKKNHTLTFDLPD
jgi:hypothetical protein